MVRGLGYDEVVCLLVKLSDGKILIDDTDLTPHLSKEAIADCRTADDDEANLVLSVSVQWDFRYGTPQAFDPNFGNYLPGDPPVVENLKVMLGKIDITKHIREEFLARYEIEAFARSEGRYA